MAQCPSCHKSVDIQDKHLGTLFTCPSCNAVFFVDWNGQPELASHEAEPEAAPEAPFEAPSEQNYEGVQNFEPPPGFDPMSSTPPDPIESHSANYGEETRIEPYAPPIQQNEDQYSSPSGDEPYQTPENEHIGETDNAALYAVESTSSESSLEESIQAEAEAKKEAAEAYDFSQSLDQQRPEPTISRSNDSSSFADVMDFANTDTGSGPLTYVVIIDGIESSLLLKQLKEAMTDSRFGWDVAEILSKMAGGRLILNGLSPAKASVIINRIKYLPFKISWRQDVLSSS